VAQCAYWRTFASGYTGRYRAVFTLVEVEGYSHKEVSSLLNIAEGTSKSQLYHAKKMLQRLLKPIYTHGREK
jgi:DNA-directed RNA polymerase specialized sigma24 family protein